MIESKTGVNLHRLLNDRNDGLYDRVHLYSEETGVSIEKCLHDALTDWLDNSASVNVEAFRVHKPKPKLNLLKYNA